MQPASCELAKHNEHVIDYERAHHHDHDSNDEHIRPARASSVYM